MPSEQERVMAGKDGSEIGMDQDGDVCERGGKRGKGRKIQKRAAGRGGDGDGTGWLAGCEGDK